MSRLGTWTTMTHRQLTWSILSLVTLPRLFQKSRSVKTALHSSALLKVKWTFSILPTRISSTTSCEQAKCCEWTTPRIPHSRAQSPLSVTLSFPEQKLIEYTPPTSADGDIRVRAQMTVRSPNLGSHLCVLCHPPQEIIRVLRFWFHL